ncbi:MAG: ABC transporter permease [Helicobacteraceae bacterium]|jgi:putative ABC transport system permease protein|nr:ABC transporter permease [Helicobacteraceae bacterium]
MAQNLTAFMVRRYLKFDPNQPFISIAAILAFLGVTIGVMVLIIAMAIMSGFIKEFGEKLFVMNYPITLQPKFAEFIERRDIEKLERKFPKLAFSPYIYAGALSRNGSAMQGNVVFGVHFDKERKANKVLDRAMTREQYESFDVIAGETLLETLRIKEIDGEKKVLLIFSHYQPAGAMLTPVMKRFRIADAYNSGLTEFDKAYLFARYEDICLLLGIEEGLYHGVHIYAKEPMSEIAEVAEAAGKDIKATGWWEKNASFFASFELEKRALFLVLMLIILVAAMNIISSQMMTVLSRRKEIALLMSLGASRREVSRIFFRMGAIIGAGGIAVGSALGFAGLWALSTFDLVKLPPEVYGMSKLPLHFTGADFAAIAIGAFVIVIFSSWYPAKKAAATDALDALRNE